MSMQLAYPGQMDTSLVPSGAKFFQVFWSHATETVFDAPDYTHLPSVLKMLSREK
jgi:hypothetical protein